MLPEKKTEKQIKNSFSHVEEGKQREQQQKCEITVEATVYYARFMIYLCSETQNRVDKQGQKALIYFPEY